MKRITLLFILYFGIFETAYAALPIPAFIMSISEAVKSHFAKHHSVATDIKTKPSLEIEDLGAVSVKDLFKDKNTTVDTAYITIRYSIITHIKLVQEIKERFNIRTKDKTKTPDETSTEETPKKKLTQTEVYLNRYQTGINSAFGSNIKTYKGLIDNIIEQERKLSDTHYFFYHAHDKELIILHDFIKLLHSYMNLIGPRLDFTFMRFKNTPALSCKNVNEYLDTHLDIYDHDLVTRSQMISVNLSLFGNHGNMGECTFNYFLNNMSISSIGLYKRLEPIFSHYKFDSKYLSELIDLTAHLASPTGNLLQICVPKDMVDDLAYLSQPYGKPYRDIILKEYYDYTKNRHTSISPLLEHMRTSPDLINNLSQWQARLMFFDPLLDMHPLIKIFRYNTITPENMAIYQQKLNTIVARLVLDYLKVANISGKEPLIKLHYYMMMHKDASPLL